MYAKSLFATALLIASVAATNHEVVAAAAAPPAHAAPAAAPAVHEPMAVVPAKHEVMATPAAPPAAENKHEMAAPPAAHQTVAAAAAPMDKAHQALTVHLVAVGDNNGSLKYFPDTVHAMPGDVVQFQFHPKVSSSPTTVRYAA